jgi:hypothetical protein
MNVVKKTNEYTIYQKRSNHYAVKDTNNRWVNGDEKVKILLAENLIKALKPKQKEQPSEQPQA